jgi:ankyrin repeat protein
VLLCTYGVDFYPCAYKGSVIHTVLSPGYIPVIEYQKQTSATIQCLLEHAAIDPNMCSVDGANRPPIYDAIGNDDELALRVLLSCDSVDPNMLNGYRGTPLVWAAANGWSGMVKVLLKCVRVDVNASETRGRTALSMAAGRGHEDCTRLLLACDRVDVNLSDSQGIGPLAYAASCGYINTLKLVLDSGRADVDAKDYNGSTALGIITENVHRINEGIVRCLLASGADPRLGNLSRLTLKGV